MDELTNNTEGSKTISGHPICARCGKHIYDGTILKVQGQFWHNSCLQCVICRKEVTGYCHVKRNDVYCRLDYIRLYGTKCCACTQVIIPTESVRVANGNVYHTACFTCSTCNNSVKTGEYFYLKEDGRILCCHDYQRATRAESNVYSDSDTDESGSDERNEDQHMCINGNQLHILNERYQTTRRPSRGYRRILSQETGLSCRTIQLWFHNRRSKDKSSRRKFTSGMHTYESDVRNTLQPSTFNSWSSPPQTESSLQTSVPFGSQTTSRNASLYCPLDYMVPDSMPPNVDLSCTDIRNGEVILGKQMTGHTKGITPSLTAETYGQHWLVA